MRYLTAWIFLIPLSSIGQQIDTISVCTDKTVYVLFSSNVTLVDVGTKGSYDFFVKDNMVMLKAIRPDASPTSLMVKTGKDVFVWILRYRRELLTLLVDRSGPERSSQKPNNNVASLTDTSNALPASIQTKPAHTHQGERPSIKNDRPTDGNLVGKRQAQDNRDRKLADESMEAKVKRLLDEKPAFRDLGEIRNGVYITLLNLAVDEKYLYIKLSLFNTSSIAFELDVMYFERNQGKTLKKKEARSRTNMPAIYRESVFNVAPGGEEVMVYVLNLFAFQERDRLLVKVNERGGVRSLQFFIPAKEIVNARRI